MVEERQVDRLLSFDCFRLNYKIGSLHKHFLIIRCQQTKISTVLVAKKIRLFQLYWNYIKRSPIQIVLTFPDLFFTSFISMADETRPRTKFGNESSARWNRCWFYPKWPSLSIWIVYNWSEVQNHAQANTAWILNFSIRTLRYKQENVGSLSSN